MIDGRPERVALSSAAVLRIGNCCVPASAWICWKDRWVKS